MRLTQKRLDLTFRKHHGEYLANMRRISGNDTAEEECYFLLDFLIKVYPESLKLSPTDPEVFFHFQIKRSRRF